MKKIIGKILIAVMVMSPIAAADLTLSFADNGADLDLNYVVTGNTIVGVALDVATSAALTGVTTTASLPVHIDWINTHASDGGGMTLDPVTGVVNGGTHAPSDGIADTAAAGTASAIAGTPFCISIASLAGSLSGSGTLATISGAAGTTVDVTVNSPRSATGAVSTSGDETVNLPAQGVIPILGCACPGDAADDFGNAGSNNFVDIGDLNFLLITLSNNAFNPIPAGPTDCGDAADDFGNAGQNGFIDIGDLNFILIELSNNGFVAIACP